MIPGRGVAAKVEGYHVLAGNRAMLNENNITFPQQDDNTGKYSSTTPNLDIAKPPVLTHYFLPTSSREDPSIIMAARRWEPKASSFFTQVSNSGFLSAVLPYGHIHHSFLPDPLVILLLPRCHQKGQQFYLLRLRYAFCGR